MGPMHREWGRRAAAAFKRRAAKDGRMWWAAFSEGYTDSLTPSVNEALERKDYAKAAELIERMVTAD